MIVSVARSILALGLGFSLASASNAQHSTLIIDDFSSSGPWTAHPADGVGLTLGSDAVEENPALRLDFHFEGGGYAIARRELDLPLPANYEFNFRVRGLGPSNHLEFKLVDGSGENVWWHVWRNVEFGSDYQTFRIRKRKIQFAWGPLGGGEIDTVRAIEFAITAGEGGTGTVWIDDLTLVPLALPDTTPLRVTARASSNSERTNTALDGNADTVWSADGADPAPWFLLDLGRPHEFSGLVLDWGSRHPRNYRIDLSDDGNDWSEVASVQGSDGARDPVFLPDSEARFLRVAATDAPMEIREIEVVPLERFADREAFFHEIATAAPRGLYPRGIFGEQAYWTVIGLDHDEREVLVGEEGAVEIWAGGPSVEPFLGLDGELLTWADARIETSLEDGYLPIPTVRWSLPELTLEITAFAAGASGKATVFVRYRTSNVSARELAGDLFLAIRPFQVNPPSQSLNLKGGTTRLSRLAASRAGAFVDERAWLRTHPPADRAGAVSFAGGDIIADHLFAGRIPESKRTPESAQLPESGEVQDPFGAASGVLAFALSLGPGESREVVLRFPIGELESDSTDEAPDAGEAPSGPQALNSEGESLVLSPTGTDTRTANRALREGDGSSSDVGDNVLDFGRLLEEAKQGWHEKLDRVRIELPPAGQRSLETMRSQLGFILVNRAGPAIQPGVRSYARSWIRDGALTSSALLRTGHADAAIEFLEWFAPHQYPNGKIPCVVDSRGADPVPEHDSSGEFIFLVAEIFRFTGDRALADRQWPRVLAAVGYLDSLRHERLQPLYMTPEMSAYYGILPPSISHEGYSAKPMHSYWDDFFAFKGFKDAALLARELGKPEAGELEALAQEFARDLGASIQAAQDLHGIDWVPGCADLGDFDATSTTIAVTPVGVDGVVPANDLQLTFERYLSFFRERARTQEWDAYTPYELRNVGTFVRLGWREEAHELMEFFFADQRPGGWRSWAEVVSREERKPRFLGDLPHTWVGSDYIRSFLDMFLAVDPDGRFAIIGAGVPWEWLAGSGVLIEGLPTPFGELELRMERLGKESARVWIGGDLTAPPQGWILRPPLPASPRSVRVDGREVPPAAEIRIDDTPTEVVFSW